MTYTGSPSDQYRLPLPSHREGNSDVVEVWRLLLYWGACGAPPLDPPSAPARVLALGGRGGAPNWQYISCGVL